MTYREARRWHVRPSELFGIEDTYTAFCFDQAIGYAGEYIEVELDKVGHKPDKKERGVIEGRKKKLESLLGTTAAGKPQAGFADPASMLK